MTLTLDDLLNIRDALNERIETLVKNAPTQKGNYTRASQHAATRDKVQDEIDKRRAQSPG